MEAQPQLMSGYYCLEGGSEFQGAMSLPDLLAMSLAGGAEAPLGIIPAAAAPDNNHERAGQLGRRWFESLGAKAVQVVPLLDHASANDPDIADRLRRLAWIYMLGGFPGHLAAALVDSLSATAMREAWEYGAVIAGSSAGAMVMCSTVYDPQSQQLTAGLGLLRHSCFLPHHNRFGKRWADDLRRRLPDSMLIGVDEETGCIGPGPDGVWQVLGGGSVTLYLDAGVATYSAGSMFTLPHLVLRLGNSQT
jgi:cyanophycinase